MSCEEDCRPIFSHVLLKCESGIRRVESLSEFELCIERPGCPFPCAPSRKTSRIQRYPRKCAALGVVEVRTYLMPDELVFREDVVRSFVERGPVSSGC